MLIKHLKSYLRRLDHVLLLGSLLFLVASPIWEEMIRLGWLWTDLSSILIIVAGLSVTYSHNVKSLNFRFYFGLITIILSIVELFFGVSAGFEMLVQYMQVIFFLILTILLFYLIMRADKVDGEVLVNAVSGYLLLGLSWAIIIALWSNSFPNSFSFNPEQGDVFFNEMYYSFVTLTTLGYGDMLPLTAPAKSFSILISVTGAFYTTIVLGMIVGKFIATQSNNKN